MALLPDSFGRGGRGTRGGRGERKRKGKGERERLSGLGGIPGYYGFLLSFSLSPKLFTAAVCLCPRFGGLFREEIRGRGKGEEEERKEEGKHIRSGDGA